MVPIISLIPGNEGLNIIFYVRDPEKAHRCAEPRFGILFIKIGRGALAVVSCKNKKAEKTSRVNNFGAQSHTCIETNPLGGS